MSDTIKYIFESADRLGALNPASIWALVALAMGWHIYNTGKQSKKNMEEWQKIRISDAQSDYILAQAVQKMADEMAQIKTIMNERLPSRKD